MTALRQQLIDELILRGYSPKTLEAYVGAVAGLAAYHKRPPDQLGDKEIRGYLLHLHTETTKAASTINVAVSGLRFFYVKVLRRPFYHLERGLPRVRREKRIPKAYSLDEIRQLLECGCTNFKHRLFLMTVYSAGLRLNEACHLRFRDIDSSRMMIRVEQGKGRKDRYTLLSSRLLEQLRSYYRFCPSKCWIFPATRDPGQPMSDGTGQHIFYHAVTRAGLPNKGGIHTLRHSFATHLVEAGLEIYILKRLLGHTSLSTTAGYLHVSRERIAEVKSPFDLIEQS